MTTQFLHNPGAPTVSVVSIALKQEEFLPLIERLEKQTFQDYEFVGEAGGSIPEAWNRALRRARGDIIVFTETDAFAVDEYWLEEMVESVVDRGCIYKGLEISDRAADLSNLAAYRTALQRVELDDNFPGAEGVELLSRMKSHGCEIKFIDRAPVIHRNKTKTKRYLRRAFFYGLFWARLKARFSDPYEIGEVAYASYNLQVAVRKLLGFLIGLLIYLPERRMRKQRS